MARTWEWRMRSWAGTRSQRGVAEAKVTLDAGLEVGLGTISQRSLGDWANCHREWCEADRGEADGVSAKFAAGSGGRGGSRSGNAETLAPKAVLGKGGRGGGAPRVQVVAAAG